MRRIALILALVTLSWGWAAEKTHEVSVCAVFRNEAAWLQEWIEFHKLAGVEQFHLYNHLSSDNYPTVLKEYIEAGEVDLVDLPAVSFEEAKHRAFNDCLRRQAGKSRWIAFIDVDEFLVPEGASKIGEVLQDSDGAAAVTLIPQIIGASGIPRLEPGELLVEKATASLGNGSPKRRRWIVRPEETKACSPTLGFYLLPNQKAVAVQGLHLNQYWGRTEEWARGEKIVRLRKPQLDAAGRVAAFFVSFDEAKAAVDRYLARESTHEEHAIERFLPELKQRLFPSVDCG